MDEYKLVYFNSRGRAEVIRLIFSVVEQKYDDSRISNSDWSVHKKSGKAPFGQLPYLVVKKKDNSELIISQSMTIVRYLGKKFNLLGKTAEEQAECEMYLDQINDIFTEFTRIFFEKNTSEKSSLTKKFNDEVMPKNMHFFEKKLSDSASGFLIGNALTVVDLSLVVSLETLTNGGFKTIDIDQIYKGFPSIEKHYQKILALPQIACWMKSRPETDF